MMVVRRCFAVLFLAVASLSAPAVAVPAVGAAAGDEFQPIAPVRLLDTRSGNGAPMAKVGPGQTIDVQITGRGGIPAAGVKAISVNITATGGTAASFVSVWPQGQTRPNASVLNFGAGTTIANSTVVGVSADGMISIYNNSGSTHILADISGYFPIANRFSPITPARLLDTRTGNGAPVAKIGPGQTVTVQIAGRGGVPASGVAAVAVNLTVTGATKDSFLTAWPAGQTRPNASILNFQANANIANSTIIGLSANGRMSIFNSSGSTHVLADVAGWFPTGSGFVGLAPGRVLDTRSGNGAPIGKVGPGETITVQITGRGGLPAIGVAAVAINFTTTGPTESSFLTAWPAGGARPSASILNFPAGRTIANSAIVGVSASGRISIYNHSGDTHIIADVSGFFAAVPVATNQVAAGFDHSCAIAAGGTVKCWGANDSGQLGNGTFNDSLVPVTVSGLTGVIGLTAGGTFSCALLTTGGAKCWGGNWSGALGDGTSNHRSTPVPVSGLTGATQISAGSGHACARLSNGTVKCWGANETGQLGDGSTTNSLTPISVGGVTGAIEVTAGYEHTCALLSTGGAKCWGTNFAGMLGNGTFTPSFDPVTVSNLSGAVQIFAADSHTCATINNGTVRCWGLNSWGQVGDGTTNSRSVPVNVVGLTSAVQVTGGLEHSCAVLVDGSGRCWGDNAVGQLGRGNLTSSLTPVVVSGLGIAMNIDSDEDHTCALVVGGQVKCWGRNTFGELGDGTTTNRSAPVFVSGF